jgi:DNA-binding transcriptional MerR regulator
MTTAEKEPHLLIGELAQRAGVNSKTIRYYEQVGLLLEPERSASGYRLYRIADADRLRFVKGAQQLGFPLGEIREILALRDGGQAPCRYIAERLEQRARDVDRQIADLKQLKTELADLRRRATELSTTDAAPDGYCHILESAAPHFRH